MVLAEKKKYTTGRIYYVLINTSTMEKKRWQPPRGLIQEADIDKALYHAAENFALETNCETEQIGNTLLQNIVSDANTTLSQYATSVFMPRKQITLAEHTRDLWQRCLTLRILPRLGSKPLGEITSGIINDFLLGCQSEGLAIGTVRQYYGVLRQLFKMACQLDNAISSDPMLNVPRPRPKPDECVNPPVDICTESEIAYIEQCLASEPLNWQALIALLIDTGMRIGECCGLYWTDVDLDRKTVTVHATLGYTPSRGIYRSLTKNKKSRTVGISDEVVRILTILLRSRQNCKNPYVFTNAKSDGPMNPQLPYKHLRNFQRKYGIEHLHPHKFRHSFASIAITNGADVASVSAILGHSDQTVTLTRYTCATEQSIQRCSDIRRHAVKAASEKPAQINFLDLL